jgi:hypothetical protein
MFTMPRKGIVNVKMVITEEKILSNIEKVHRIINPDSKKQIIELDDNSYFKDLIESIKTYLIEYPKKKNFPKSVYDAAFSLVEYATEQFDANTKKVESLIKQREINTKLGAILKQTLAIIQTPNAEWQKAIINVQNRYPAEIISALNVVGFENGKPEKSAKYKEAVKLINARVSNLETNLHIEIDLERIEDKSKALSYIGIEIADALKTIPTPRNSESIESIEQPMVEEVKNEVVEQPIIEQPVTVVEQPVQMSPVAEIKEEPVELAVEEEMAKFDIPQVSQIAPQPQIQPQIQPKVQQQMQVHAPVSEPVQAVETPVQAPRRVTAADIAAAQRELMAEEMQRRQTVQKTAPQQARVPQQLNVPRYGQVINPQRQIERQQVAQMQQQRIQQQRQAQVQQAQRQAVAPQQSVYENHVAETTKEVKPSLWQRFKKTKFARAFSYLFKVRVVLQLPEGQEDQSR